MSACTGRQAPMRILLLTTGLRLGGAEQQVSALARRFAELGHAVMVMSLTGACEVALPSDVTLVSLAMAKTPWSMARALIQARRCIRRWRPDVIHSHMVHANLLARLVVASGAGMPPLICTAHSAHEGGKSRMLAYRWTDRWATLNTHVSAEGMQAMIARGAVPADRIVVIPNGIDTQRFRPDSAWRAATRAALGIAPNQPLVLHVGRLVREKNQALLLDAFARLSRMPGHADTQLRIAGDGPLRPALEERVVRLGLAQRVRLLGARADVPWLLNAADLFVLSSDVEGMPLAVGEALACGCPVVATDAPGVREVAGDFGRIVPRGDAEALASAMMQALVAGRGPIDSELARHRHIDGGIGLDAVGARWLDCYVRLAATPQTRTELA